MEEKLMGKVGAESLSEDKEYKGLVVLETVSKRVE